MLLNVFIVSCRRTVIRVSIELQLVSNPIHRRVSVSELNYIVVRSHTCLKESDPLAVMLF